MDFTFTHTHTHTHTHTDTRLDTRMHARTHTHTPSLVAQMIKNLAYNTGDLGLSLSWEDPLAKGMATHSGILAWRVPWTEEPVGLQSMGLQRVGHN